MAGHVLAEDTSVHGCNLLGKSSNLTVLYKENWRSGAMESRGEYFSSAREVLGSTPSTWGYR